MSISIRLVATKIQFHITDLFVREGDGLPLQRAGNVESVSMSGRHYARGILSIYQYWTIWHFSTPFTKITSGNFLIKIIIFHPLCPSDTITLTCISVMNHVWFPSRIMKNNILVTDITFVFTVLFVVRLPNSQSRNVDQAKLNKYHLQT